MKKALALVLTVLTFNAQAQSYMSPQSWDNPSEQFDATRVMTNQTNVIWKRFDNVQEGCSAESQKLGLGKITQPILACSFWTTTSCTIITSKRPNMHNLGHELRHCFQGEWHK
jgi:hypothetical protein